MSKPDDIPQDVWDETASLANTDCTWFEQREKIACAILAEREANARKVDAIADSVSTPRKSEDPIYGRVRDCVADTCATALRKAAYAIREGR